MGRLTGAIPAIRQWMRSFLADRPQPAAQVEVGYSGGGPAAQRMCIQVTVLKPALRALGLGAVRP